MRNKELDLLPFMRRWDMLPPEGGRILCAVSGGRDSMCLLHTLWQLGQRGNFSVAAVHMNHGQRDTARRDELFVQNFCRERRIPCVTERVSVPFSAEEQPTTYFASHGIMRIMCLGQTSAHRPQP